MSHWHSCCLAFLWHYRCHQHSCQWELSTFQDCLVLALWWAFWLLLDWICAVNTYEPQCHNLRSLLSMYLVDPLHNIGIHHPLIESSCSSYLHLCIFCIRVLLFFIVCFDLRVWSLWFVVYIRIIVNLNFASGSICLSLLLRDTDIFHRRSCTFLLWPWHWVSPNQSSHLGIKQKLMPTTNTSCYCYCDDYFFDGEVQCWLTTIKPLLQLSVLGSPLHLFNAMTSSPSQANWWHCLTKDCQTVFLSSILCGL